MMVFGPSLAKRIYLKFRPPYPKRIVFISRDSLDTSEESLPRFPLPLDFERPKGGKGLRPL